MNDDDMLLDGIERPKFPAEYAGQRLFTKTDDWFNNAQIGWSPMPIDLYASGYKDAGDLLSEALQDRRGSLDSVVYPLVFMYRQGIELKLKSLLPLARRLGGRDAKKDHQHQLLPMWKELRALLEEFGPSTGTHDLVEVESFIEQLHEVDSGSFAFRYPTDRKGEVSLPSITHIDVRHLTEIMASIFMLFDGIHGWMDVEEEAGQ
jgi:hypothetical protein